MWACLSLCLFVGPLVAWFLHVKVKRAYCSHISSHMHACTNTCTHACTTHHAHMHSRTHTHTQPQTHKTTYSGLPLHTKSEGGEKERRSKSKTINRNKGIGGNSRLEGTGRMDQSDSDSEPECRQTNRKKPRMSKLNLSIFYISLTYLNI